MLCHRAYQSPAVVAPQISNSSLQSFRHLANYIENYTQRAPHLYEPFTL
jgi:hypothetical protein